MSKTKTSRTNLKPSIKQIMLGIGLSMMMLTLNGCVTSSQESDFCYIYLPVYTSIEDTEQTKEQVDMNNAVWVELCE